MPDVTIDLGGAPRALRLDLGAWAALEAQGFEVGELFAGFQGGAKRFTALRALVWAMCQHAEAPPTLADVGRWIDGHNLASVMEAVGRALRDAFPEGEGKPDPRAAAGTGGSSGGSRRARSG